MKNIFKLCSLLLAVLISSCSQEGIDVVGGGSDDQLYGKVSLALGAKGEFTLINKNGSNKELTKAPSVDVNNFSVALYRSSGDLYTRFEKYSEIPAVSKLPVGTYSVVVESSALEGVAFDSPYYLGKDEHISVSQDQLTEVEVVCTLSNSLLSFAVTDEFKSQYRDYYITITNDNGSVVISPTETRAVYVDPSLPYTVTVSAWDYDTVEGDAPTTFVYSDLKADVQTHYQMNVDMSSVGTSSVTVVIDPTVIEQNFEIIVPSEENLGDNEAPVWPTEPGDDTTPDDPEPEIPTPDDPEPEVEMPTIVGEGFDIAGELTITDADIAAGNAAVVATVSAPNGGIANLYATLDSPDIGQSLIDALFDGSATFDLANLVEGSQTKSMLLSVGLITDDTVIKGEKSYLFDVSAFMSLLTVGPNGSQTHKFHIKVVDSEGNESSQTLTIVRTN